MLVKLGGNRQFSTLAAKNIQNSEYGMQCFMYYKGPLRLIRPVTLICRETLSFAIRHIFFYISLQNNLLVRTLFSRLSSFRERINVKIKS